MGVRLYPNTQSVANLEALAGVPAGTAARLEAIEKRHQAELEAAQPQERYDLGYRHWTEINDDEALGALSHFLLSGWGKFDGIGIAEGYAGHLNDADAVQQLFDANGINANVALTEGVHWS